MGLALPVVMAALPAAGQAADADGAIRPLSELRGELETFGLSFQLGVTTVFQAAVSDVDAGRDTLASFSYDFTGTWTLLDDAKSTGAVGWLVEGGRAVFSDRESDLSSEAGVAQGLNDDLDNTDLLLSELWWTQLFADDTLQLTVGRLDQTVYFDANAVANDETTGFLATPLVNAVAVAFPENGLGANLTWTPEAGTHYVSLGLGNANADGGESLLNELGGGDVFAGIELGWTPTFGDGLQGNYRLLGWTTRVADGSDGVGISLSADQQIGGGWTLFGRWSVGEDEVLDFDRAVSGGFGLSGLNGREGDLLGVGVSYARASGGGDETLAEVFYRYAVNDRVSVTPHVQLVDDPLGDVSGDTLTVLGVRVQATF